MLSSVPYVSKLFIYPIKSLDRVNRDRVTVLKSGALQGDRTWAIFDRSGNFVNGKSHQKIHSIRSTFDPDTNKLLLGIQGSAKTVKFDVIEEREAICQWLESCLGFPVEIKQDLKLGFPDDTVSPGATIVSTATLEAIADWYPELDLESTRRRFRSNIEIDGVPPFWEDCLFSTAEKTVKFKVGEVEYLGINPCQRCIVITRDPQTGEPYPKFQKTFITQRKKTLPEWTERSRFNHFFRLAVNTRLSANQSGNTISVGDRVTLN